MNPKTFTLLNTFLSNGAYCLVAGALGILCLLWFCRAWCELRKTIRLLSSPERGLQPASSPLDGRSLSAIGYRLCPCCHDLHDASEHCPNCCAARAELEKSQFSPLPQLPPVQIPIHFSKN